MFYSSSFFKWIINLWTDLNFVIFTAWFIYPDKFAFKGNYCTGYCSINEKLMFSLLTYNLITVGYFDSPLAMTHIDLTLTCATKGTTSKI